METLTVQGTETKQVRMDLDGTQQRRVFEEMLERWYGWPRGARLRHGTVEVNDICPETGKDWGTRTVRVAGPLDQVVWMLYLAHPVWGGTELDKDEAFRQMLRPTALPADAAGRLEPIAEDYRNAALRHVRLLLKERHEGMRRAAERYDAMSRDVDARKAWVSRHAARMLQRVIEDVEALLPPGTLPEAQAGADAVAEPGPFPINDCGGYRLMKLPKGTVVAYVPDNEASENPEVAQ